MASAQIMFRYEISSLGTCSSIMVLQVFDTKISVIITNPCINKENINKGESFDYRMSSSN